MWDICAGNLGMRVSPETTSKKICAIRWSQLVTFCSRRTRWKPSACRKSLTHFYHIMLCTSPWARFELTTSVVIGTDCIGSCKSNYHTITVTTAPYINMQQFSVRKFKKYISQTCHNPEGNHLGSPNCAYSFVCRFGRHPHPQISSTNVPHSYL
jgi:hypothetical protein